MDLPGAGDFERTMTGLLRASHLMPPDDIVATIAEHTRPLGVRQVAVYLADLQQGWLRALPGGQTGSGGQLAIDTTPAGWAFRTVRAQTAETDGGPARLWLPLVDGTERLGVLELVVDDTGERARLRYQAVASLIALVIVSKSAYSDTFARVRRVQPMRVQAELEWTFMPPLSFATPDVLVNVALEPAYAVGGDAFDYGVLGDRLHVSIFDASGHDLTAGTIATTAMATCRNARRSGAALAEIADLADEVVHTQFGPDRFATALLCDLHLPTGRFTWLPCGHPPPLLVRNTRVAEWAAPPRPPLGLGRLMTGRSADHVQRRQLRPGDRLLLYTDGITEARKADGEYFGLGRLVAFIGRHSGDGLPAPEMLRRLTRAILAHHDQQLSDDATIVQLHFKPDPPEVLSLDASTSP